MKKGLEMNVFQRIFRSRQARLAPLPVFVDIPGTFTELQAKTILGLSKISATDSGIAEQVLQAWTPERFTGAQARCIHEMLQLDADDLRATLADAMEPCDLRRKLRSGHEIEEGEPASGVEMPQETEGTGPDLTKRPTMASAS